MIRRETSLELPIYRYHRKEFQKVLKTYPFVANHHYTWMVKSEFDGIPGIPFRTTYRFTAVPWVGEL